MSQFDEASAGELKADVEPQAHITRLGDALAEHQENDNKHRRSLFRFVCCVVGASLLAVCTVVTLLGFGLMQLATPIAVAFISAVAVQSFVLIGFLARGLFMVRPRDDQTPSSS